jgi:hypothetical protein
MKLKVEVESAFVESRGGISAKGKPWQMREQKAWFYLGSKFPKEVTLTLEGDQPAYAPGMYEVDLLPALNVGDFGRLEIDGRRLLLVALAEKPALSAAK